MSQLVAVLSTAGGLAFFSSSSTFFRIHRSTPILILGRHSLDQMGFSFIAQSSCVKTILINDICEVDSHVTTGSMENMTKEGVKCIKTHGGRQGALQVVPVEGSADFLPYLTIINRLRGGSLGV